MVESGSVSTWGNLHEKIAAQGRIRRYRRGRFVWFDCLGLARTRRGLIGSLRARWDGIPSDEQHHRSVQ